MIITSSTRAKPSGMWLVIYTAHSYSKQRKVAFSRQYSSRTPESVASKAFDYIIVGGVYLLFIHDKVIYSHGEMRDRSHAGCVLTSKLSADPNISVLLLECWLVLNIQASQLPLIPMDYRPLTAPRYSWLSAPLLRLLGTLPLEMISGEALCETLKINACVYARLTPEEYNASDEAGHKDWGWQNIDPYFVNLEKMLSYKSPCHDDKGWY
jgi:choline dehydrogenase